MTISKWPAGLAAVAAGVLLAVQGRINGELGAQLQDGVLAALISTGGGLVLLVAAVLGTAVGRRGLARVGEAVAKRELRWWQCLGGFVGAYLVSTQGIVITSLGVAVFTVATVSGQLISSLLVDRAGLGPGGRQPVTRWRVLGAAMALGAVLLAVQEQFARPESLWLFALPALAGFGLAWQSAVNGQVRSAAENTAVATMINFGAATTMLVVATVVDLSLRGWPASAPSQWWLYIGGVCGIFVIASTAVVVRTIGVLLLSLSMVAGQLLGAVLLDVLVPARSAQLSLAELLGTVITLFAVLVAAVPATGESESDSERMSA